ncbi:MAG: hypothetical protein CMQ15_01505 [Gammaproteobacteria bacterium]|nr:hypothetical protein [Gammaproteobacteria bacterium]
MLNRFYIVDDFYGDPDKLVKVALDSPKTDISRGLYAGVTSENHYLNEAHREFFKDLLHEPSIDWATNLTGRIRFSQANDSYKQLIHPDLGSNTKWAGFIYLSKNHPSIEGTAFWKHLRTGLEELPRTDESLVNHGWLSIQDVQNFLETDGIDESLWKKTFSVPYKYNRLVLFRPWLFHAPGPSFGSTLESSRMIQTFFLGN